MNSVLVHRATLDEADLAYALVEEYFQAARVVVREDRARFECDYFAANAGFWLAAADNQLAGCIALRELRSGGAALGEIKRMYVRPACRGRGVGDALLHALEAYAASCGHRELVLDTTDEMTSAVRLYERNGYTRRSRYNQNPQATIFMGKQIGLSACSESEPASHGNPRRRLTPGAK